MGFRCLELSTPAEIHIHRNQLTIEQQDTSFTIPVEDLDIVIASGSNIRLSTMDISILAENNVLFMTIGKDYLPTSMTLTFRSSSRRSLIMRRQLELPKRRTNRLWDDIIRAKIMNQADALRLLDIPGSEDVRRLIGKVSHGDRRNAEAQAAALYFQLYHPGLNRRVPLPVNSCLNYSYSVLRSAVARSAAAHGFLLSFGIHHRSMLNQFNLADDLIEPFRPFADLIAFSTVNSNVVLSKEQKRCLMSVLYMECTIDRMHTTVTNAIDIMIDSVKRYVMDEADTLSMPSIILPGKELESNANHCTSQPDE